MGIFSAIGGLLGGGKAKKASRRAQAAQVAFENRGLDELIRQFNITNENFAPARSLLAPSVAGLSDLNGLNGLEAQQAAIGNIQASPMYQRLYDVGEEALLQNAAATGGLRGGNMQEGLAGFAKDTLLDAIMRQQQSLGQMAGIGLGAVDSTAGYGARNSENIAGNYSRQGGITAGGILTRGGITAGQYSNGGAILDQLASMAAGGGGGWMSKLGKLF